MIEALFFMLYTEGSYFYPTASNTQPTNKS
jgi:hypothetical protein